MAAVQEDVGSGIPAQAGFPVAHWQKERLNNPLSGGKGNSWRTV